MPRKQSSVQKHQSVSIQLPNLLPFASILSVSAALCCNMCTLIESVTHDSVQIRIHRQLKDGRNTSTSSGIQHYMDLSTVSLSALQLSTLITSLYSTVYQSLTITEAPGFHLRGVDGAGIESRGHEVRAHLTTRGGRM